MVSPDLAAKFERSRQAASLIGADWQTTFAKNMNGLNPMERFAVGKIMEGDFQPGVLEGMIKPDRIAAVSNAAESNTALLQSIKQAAQDAHLVSRSPDGTLHEFVGIGQNYMPHRIVNTQQFVEDTPVAKEAVQTLIKNPSWAKNNLAGVTDAADKQTIAREWIKDFHARMSGENEATATVPGRPSFGHLMGRNLGLPGYETDLNLVFPQYAEHMSRRIALAGEFGPIQQIPEMISGEAAPSAAIPGQLGAPAAVGPRAEYPQAYEAVDAMPDGLRKQIGLEAIDAALGKMKQPGPLLRSVGRPLINWQVYNKLGWGQLGQFGQIVSDVVPNGFKGITNSLIKAAVKDPETIDFLSRSGAISHGVVRRAEEALTGGANQFLEKTGFTSADLYARAVGALQGKAAAQLAAKDLYQLSKKMTPDAGPLLQKQYGKIAGKLQDLGIDPKDVVTQAGILTKDQFLKAANSNAFKANFWGDALSLPRALNTPEGRFFFQFKSWGYQQAKFIKDTVVKPAMRGDYGPLTRWLAGSQLSGEAIADLKAMARQQKRPSGAIARIMQNEAQGSGLGILDDVLGAITRGDAGFYGLAGGPTMGDIASGVEATKELGQGHPKKAERFAIQRGLPLLSPVIGPGAAMFAPAMANALVPPNQPKESK
jgi:hypothetical protein